MGEMIINYSKLNGLSNTAKKAADYNQDGKITSSDYVLIKDYIMGE